MSQPNGVNIIAGDTKINPHIFNVDNEIAKIKKEYQKYYSNVDNLNIKEEIEDMKLRLETLPGGNALEMLVKEHPVYQQAIQELLNLKMENETLKGKIAFICSLNNIKDR